MPSYNGGSMKTQKNKVLKLGRHMNDKKSFELFRNIVYVLDSSLPELLRTRLENLLSSNGGTLSNYKDLPVNLYVSNDELYPLPHENAVVSVTPLWVEQAITAGFVHDMCYYSPVLKQFLTGVVLLLLDLPDEDCDAIKNEIKRFGGQYRDDFSEDITHLICLDPRGTQYTQCTEINIPALLPTWLDDCFYHQEKLETRLYQFPDPIVYYESNPNPPKIYAYYEKDALKKEGDYDKVFEDEVLYFGKDINLQSDFRQILVDAVERAGGTVTNQYNHQNVTIVVLKYRSSHECRMAYKDSKLVASLWWVSNTLLRKYWCSPLSTLLDYPAPPGGLPGMEDYVITIGGYTNVFRSYIRKLIIIMGAKYESTLSPNTTHLICGKSSGEKYLEAQKSKSIIIVNQLWLEESYQSWEILDYAKEKYKFIPRTKVLSRECLGRTHLIDTELKRWMELSTIPKYSIINHDNSFPTPDEKGSIHVRKRRKAAVLASKALNAIIPDLNAFEKERTKNTKQENHRHVHK